MRLREHAPLLGLACALALGALVRVPWLGAMPNPGGDEGNWALLGLYLSEGVRPQITADAGFVTHAFAWMIAAAFRLLGPSYASARAVPVACVLGAALASFAYCARLGARRAGAAVALALALHPWSVLWSRTVSVPYALSLALAVVGPLAWLDGLRTRSPWRLLVASQLLGFAMHFSPLALVPFGACALHAVLGERAVLRGEGAAARVVAMLSGLAHVALVVPGVLAALRAGRQVAPVESELLADRLASMASMMLGDLAGTSTAQHFAGVAPWAMRAGLLVALLLVACVAARARGDALGRFAGLYLAVACVGLPVVLVPARAWHMPVIDADRYGFALVAPLALGLGALAEGPTRSARAVAAAALVWFACVTGAVAHHFVRGGGGDLGLFARAHGGRYRGWQAPRERAPLADMIRDEALREARGEPATVAYDDYAFHTARFSNAAARVGSRLTHRIARFDFPRGRRVFFVVWSDGAFSPRYEPAGVVAANRALRDRVRDGFDEPRRVRAFVTADGTPLCELWSARAR